MRNSARSARAAVKHFIAAGEGPRETLPVPEPIAATSVAERPWVRFARMGQALGINAVPAFGFFAADWSAGTTVAFYWFETVLLTTSAAALISAHRRKTRCAGHWLGIETGQQHARIRGEEPVPTRARNDFLGVMIPFTFGHGIFVAMLTFLGLPNMTGEPAPGLTELAAGALPAAVFVALGHFLDRIDLGTRPFAWVEGMARSLIGRMIVTHLTIIFGMGALAALGTPQALLGVFFVLKTGVDLAKRFPKAPLPKRPSKKVPWIARFLDRWFPSQTGKTWTQDWREFQTEFRRLNARSERRAADKERIVPRAAAGPEPAAPGA